MVGFLERYRLEREEDYNERDIDEVVYLMEQFAGIGYIPEGLISVSHEIIEHNPRLGLSLYKKISEVPQILQYIKCAVSQDIEPADDEDAKEIPDSEPHHEFLEAAAIIKNDLMFR